MACEMTSPGRGGSVGPDVRPARYSHPALRAPCRLWSPDGEGATSCDRPWRVNCEVGLSCARVGGGGLW